MKSCVTWTGSHLLSFLHFRYLLKYHFFSCLPQQPCLKEHWVGSTPYPVWFFSIVTTQLGCKHHEGRDFILSSGLYFQHQEQGLALWALSVCWMAEWMNKQLCVLPGFSLKMLVPEVEILSFLFSLPVSPLPSDISQSTLLFVDWPNESWMCGGTSLPCCRILLDAQLYLACTSP